MAQLDVYLYGMTLLSTVHRLAGPYPVADGYGEIRETHRLPGGETGNAAILLSSFGLSVRTDGPFLGRETRGEILETFGRYGVDASGLKTDEVDPGLQDLVLVDDATRTVFGRFGSFFSGKPKWSDPDRLSIRRAAVVSIDPFFGQASLSAAAYCLEEGKPYVSMDCPFDGPIHAGSAANVISREFLGREYPGRNSDELFELYRRHSQGLVVFTRGKSRILYGRGSAPVGNLKPYEVSTVGTLGAGDAFRAGVVFGVHQGWEDDRTVRFAAATAAMACVHNPIALKPPTLAEVQGLIKAQPR